MLLVKTVLKPDIRGGIGLFAAEFIPAGTRVWTFHPLIDRVLSDEQLASLPPLVQESLRKKIYQNVVDGKIVGWTLDGDEARFTNHSLQPNTRSRTPEIPNTDMFALVDIPAGEEITCNYRDFDPNGGFHEGFTFD
jgi:uncharacterized protein